MFDHTINWVPQMGINKTRSNVKLAKIYPKEKWSIKTEYYLCSSIKMGGCSSRCCDQVIECDAAMQCQLEDPNIGYGYGAYRGYRRL